MKHLINNQVILSQIPLGPLAAYIGSFADFISSQGYALCSIRRQVRLAADFSQWLNLKEIELHRISSDHPKWYLRDRARQAQPCLGAAATLSHLINFLRGEGVIFAEKVSAPQLTPAEHCTQAYEQYLREARALAEATIANYVPFIRRFLKDRFGEDRPVTLSGLSARDVVSFVQRQAPRLHRKRAKLMTSALRSFLKYAHYRGELLLDLAAAVPVVPHWSMPSIPRAISPDQAKQLLDSIDQHTAVTSRLCHFAVTCPTGITFKRSGIS
jgi:integrase/recombinase XerD